MASKVVADQAALPATARGRQSRAAIVEAAADLMYANGIARTSLDEVLAYCGAGKSQLYHYFANKQELVRAVIARQLDRVLSAQPGLDSLDSWDDLDTWATELLARHSTSAGPLACRLGTFAGEVDADDALRELLNEAFRTWQGYLRDGLKRLQSRGELAVGADPDELAAAVLAAVQGGILLSRLRRNADPLGASLTMALAYLKQFRTGKSRRR
ncbi:TetR/AcrR family transcriptional regulator [Tenggerimyces flavus]|uniref:TetR/AcrR family transcriptional regulator n=1 Tax=Tenggerimyces flavus TaxID=1708749 RepID=A0ABV7YHN2_9ACTN|nr:TetR/AcrR family transcriptional regulator [Tenggerimyces flavus]MBM7784732.1 AcrR family transcriptional regulator [Tenggerimyces flavus]